MEEQSRIITPGVRKIVLTIPAPPGPLSSVHASIQFDGFDHASTAVNMLEVARTMLLAANEILVSLAQETARAAVPMVAPTQKVPYDG